MSRTFRANSGSLLNLNDSTRCGCSLCFFQIRCTVAELTFCTAAMARTLQCVASLGVVFIVASTMAASRSTEIRLGRPLRGRSSRMPAMPSFSNRFRHNSTVGTDVDSLRASTRLASPSAAPSTILMPSTKKHDSGASEGARRATEDASESSAKAGAGRWSAKRKVSVILELLRGADLESTSRKYRVTAASLIDWRDRFLTSAEVGLKTRETGVEDEERRRLKSVVATVSVENELLREKIARLENGRPLVSWKSKA